MKASARSEDVATLRQQAKQARDAYEHAGKDFGRASRLVGDGNLPQKPLDDARTQMNLRQVLGLGAVIFAAAVATFRKRVG